MSPERLQSIERHEDQKPHEQEPKNRRELLQTFMEKGARLYDETRRLAEAAFDTVLPGRVEKKQQEKLRGRLDELRRSSSVKHLPYHEGDGVVSAVFHRQAEQEENTGSLRFPLDSRTPLISADGFRDCCSVILQSEQMGGVGAVHISPKTIGEGGDFGMQMRDNDFMSHIQSVLDELYPRIGSGKKRGQDRIFRAGEARRNQRLTPEQLQQAQQDVRVTIIGGDEAMAHELYYRFAEQRGAPNLPLTKPNMESFGIGPKTVHATPSEVFIESEVSGHLMKPLSDPGEHDRGLL